MGERVLSLETLVERPTICIDKVDYSLRTADDFGLAELVQIGKMQTQLNQLLELGETLSDEQIAALAGLLDELTGLVLDAPAAVRGRLRDAQKMAIVRVFQRETERRRTPLASANPPTGAI